MRQWSTPASCRSVPCERCGASRRRRFVVSVAAVAAAAAVAGVLVVRAGDEPSLQPADDLPKTGVETPVHPSQVEVGIDGNLMSRAALACVQRVRGGVVFGPVVLVGPPGEGYRKIQAELGVPGAHFALSDDGRWSAQLGADRVVTYADITHGLEGRLDPLPFPHEVTAIRLSPGGATLAVLWPDGGSVLARDTGQTTHLQPFRSFLGWTADGESVLVVDESGALRRDPLATYDALPMEARQSEIVGQLPSFETLSGTRLSTDAMQAAEVRSADGRSELHVSSLDGASSWSVALDDLPGARVIGWNGDKPIVWSPGGGSDSEALVAVSSQWRPAGAGHRRRVRLVVPGRGGGCVVARA